MTGRPGFSALSTQTQRAILQRIDEDPEFRSQLRDFLAQSDRMTPDEYAGGLAGLAAGATAGRAAAPAKTPPPTKEQQRDALQKELKDTLPKNLTVKLDESQPIDEQIKFLQGLRDLRDSKIGKSLFTFLRNHPNSDVEVDMVDEFSGPWDDWENNSLNAGNRGLPGNTVGKTYDTEPHWFSRGTHTLIEISTTQLENQNTRNELTGKNRHSVAEIAAHELGHATDAIERAETGEQARPQTSNGKSLSNQAACYAGMAYRREIGANEGGNASLLNQQECADLPDDGPPPSLPLTPVTRTGQNVKEAGTIVP